MRKRNWNRKFGIQRLEDRRLLAADVAVDLSFVDCEAPEICEVQSVDSQTDSQAEDASEAAAGESTNTLDLESTEIALDNLDSPPVQESDQATTDSQNDSQNENESSIHDLGDPVDGTDGFFGSIDAENPNQQFNISPSEDGMVDIVIASSFGESETRLNVTDSSGGVVLSAAVEELEGFKQVSFEGDAGENYLLTVSSEDGTEGQFQVTVGHREFVDQHADTIGESSTELTFSEGASTLEGRIENAGDIDTFRFTADADGRASLGLAELDADNATELSVQVLNSEGEQVSRGITNESVGISFDVEAGSEYFLSVNAAEGETGTYQIDLSVEPTFAEPTITEPTFTEPTTDEPTIVESTDTESAEPSGEDAETNNDDFVDVVDESTQTPSTTPALEDDLIEDVESELADAPEVVIDSAEEFNLTPVDEIDLDPIVESEPETEIVDLTEDPTGEVTGEDEVVTEVATDAELETVPEAFDPSTEVVDEVDVIDSEETTIDEALATSDEPTSTTDSDLAAEVPAVTTDPATGDSTEFLIGCDPIPVDVIDAETTVTDAPTEESPSDIANEVTEVSVPTADTPTVDLAESFELSETETEVTETTNELDVRNTVEDLIDTVLDSADHAEALDDLLIDGFDGFFSHNDVAEQAVDSFFSDADLVEDLIRL